MKDQFVSGERGIKWPAPCPKCGSDERQRFQWRPDTNPTSKRRRCFDCGYDSGWVDRTNEQGVLAL